MNLPGIPDYSIFVKSFAQQMNAMGIQGWFTGLGMAAVVFAFVWSAVLFFMGNRLGAQNQFVKAMVALLIFNLATRPEGSAFRQSLWNAYTAAHKTAVGRGVSPVANQVGNALNDIRDGLRQALLAASAFAVGGFTFTVLRGGLAGAAAAAETTATQGSSGMRVVNGLKNGASKIGWGVLALTIPYTAAMMLSGVMTYLALVLFPLGAAVLPLGYGRLFSGIVNLYLSGLLLGIAAPLVFGASVQLLNQTTIPSIMNQVQQVMTTAEELKRQNEAQIAHLRGEVDSYVEDVKQKAGNSSLNPIDRLRNWFDQRIQGFSQKLDQLMQPINNMLNSVLTWVISAAVAVLLYLLVLIAILVGSQIVLSRVAGLVR